MRNKNRIFYVLSILVIGIFIMAVPASTAKAANNGPHEGEDAFSYIECGKDGEFSYLWAVNGLAEVSTIKGITYDKKTNTIAIKNVSGNMTLVANEMGADLKLVVEGENTIGALAVYGYGYGGSLTILGSGSLEIAGRLSLFCESSESALTIKKGVTLTANEGILVDYTTLKNPIVIEDGMSIQKGGDIIIESHELYEGKEVMLPDSYYPQFIIEYKKDGDTIYVEFHSTGTQDSNGEWVFSNVNRVYRLVNGEYVYDGEISDEELWTYTTKVVGYNYSAVIADKSEFGTVYNPEKLPKTVIAPGSSDGDKAAKPDVPTVSASAKKNAVKLTISPTENADGYYIYMSESESGKYKKIKGKAISGKKYSFTKKKLKSGKTYYFKARAYKVVNGKKVWGKYSSIKKVTVK